MPNDSSTPRTDAIAFKMTPGVFKGYGSGEPLIEAVDADFARTLERELSDMTALFHESQKRRVEHEDRIHDLESAAKEAARPEGGEEVANAAKMLRHPSYGLDKIATLLERLARERDEATKPVENKEVGHARFQLVSQGWREHADLLDRLWQRLERANKLAQLSQDNEVNWMRKAEAAELALRSRSEEAERLKVALRSFLVLRTDAPGFFISFTAACREGDAALSSKAGQEGG